MSASPRTTTTDGIDVLGSLVSDADIIGVASELLAVVDGSTYCPAHDLYACPVAHGVDDSARIIAAHLGFAHTTGSVPYVASLAYVVGYRDHALTVLPA